MKLILAFMMIAFGPLQSRIDTMVWKTNPSHSAHLLDTTSTNWDTSGEYVTLRTNLELESWSIQPINNSKNHYIFLNKGMAIKKVGHTKYLIYYTKPKKKVKVYVFTPIINHSEIKR